MMAWLEGVSPVRVRILGSSESIPGTIHVRVAKAAGAYPKGIEQHVSPSRLWDSWTRVGTCRIMWSGRKWRDSVVVAGVAR